MITSISIARVQHELPPSHGSPAQDREDGWLGQVPPPSPPRPAAEPEPQPYAAPWLAPEPWKQDAPLFPHDPTLFG